MAGRPKKEYKPEYADELIELMKQGSLDCEIYANFGISKPTFIMWRKDYDDFEDAYNEGMPMCESWWSARMRQCFLDRDDKGFKYCIAIMNNKFGWDKGAPKGDNNTTNISINNMNVLQNKSRDDLLDYIKTSLVKNAGILDVKPIEVGHDDRSDQS